VICRSTTEEQGREQQLLFGLVLHPVMKLGRSLAASGAKD